MFFNRILAPTTTPVMHVDAHVIANNCEVNPKGWADGPTPTRALIEQRGSHELIAKQQSWSYDAASGELVITQDWGGSKIFTARYRRR